MIVSKKNNKYKLLRESERVIENKLHTRKDNKTVGCKMQDYSIKI